MSAGAKLFALQSCEVEKWWPYVLRHIERWVERDGVITADEVLYELKQARAQLWCLYAGEIVGVWVTRIEGSAKTKWGFVWGCAGDFEPHKEAALQGFETIEQWFKSQDCEFVEMIGRQGWERLLPGYQRHSVVLRKGL